MSVAGQREVTAARQKFNVPGHPEPVLQYQFTGSGGSQWVYYWYYRLSGKTEGELDVLQRFHLRMHHRPSSATLQVFAPSRTKEAADGARQFVRLVDAAIQSHVGKTAVRGNRRKHVTVIRSPNGD